MYVYAFVCVCINQVVDIVGRDRRYSGGGGGSMTSFRQRATRSSRDLLQGDDMETVMADALVSCKHLLFLTLTANTALHTSATFHH